MERKIIDKTQPYTLPCTDIFVPPKICSTNTIKLKGAVGMKLASDFKLPVSCFSSNLVNFSPIRVGMCYSGSSMKKSR